MPTAYSGLNLSGFYDFVIRCGGIDAFAQFLTWFEVRDILARQ
mgnify:CR=1 FL=1